MVSDSGLWSILNCLAKLRLMSGRVIVRRITMRVAFQSASNGRTEWFSPFLFFRFPLAIFKNFLHEIGNHWPSSHYDTRRERERESANNVQLSPNTWKCWKNISSAPCVSITPPLSIRLRELLESFILYTHGRGNFHFTEKSITVLVVFGFFLF